MRRAARKSAGGARAAYARASLLALLLIASGLDSGLRAQTPRRAAEPAQAPPANARSVQPSAPELEQRRFVSPEAFESSIDPATYVLGPADVLAIMILAGEPRLERLPVLPEGVVLVPNVGAVPAAGRTLQKFRDELRRHLAERYRNFELYCQLAEARQIRVYVTGEVRQPGTLVARPYERVSDLIERAGGFTESASRRALELRDSTGAPRARVDLDAYYRRGEIAANPQLAAGQVLFVPPRLREVEIAGEVALPGTYELVPGESLADLLRLAGGPKPQADLSQVSVERIDASGSVQVQSYDLRKESPRLEDVVRVVVLSSLVGKRRVFAILPDGGQRVLHLSPSETLRDLVRRVAELEPSADLQGARLVTRDSTGARRELQVDVAKVLEGKADRELQDGDILSVPAVKDYVYVSGFVARPGRYPYRADWTVGDYVGEAGGASPGGNVDRATLLTANGRKRGTDRGAHVERGDTIHINRSTSGKVGLALSAVTGVAALVISIVALTTQ